MLVSIVLITSFLFAAIYPLCFLISFDEPLKNKFHRFHLGLPTIVVGVLFFDSILFQSTTLSSYPGLLLLTWFVFLLLCNALFWNKEHANTLIITFASLFGFLYFYYSLPNFLFEISITHQNSFQIPFTISLLSGFIFCSSLYAMNLGHWYLNVHGLDIKHLRRSTYLLWFFVTFRLLWNIFQISSQNILSRGEQMPLIEYLFTMDGVILWIGILFGCFFPFVSLFFAKGTLKLKNTQATTGILYVILVSIIIGNLTYRYYLLKYGVAL